MSSPNAIDAILKDPAIKLFGRDISFASTSSLLTPHRLLSPPQNVDGHVEELVTESVCSEQHGSVPGDDWCDGRMVADEAPTDIQEAHYLDPNVLKTDDRTFQGKILKKPDKLLPCPRCESLDTKFCYFNNYNVNQPRHFCRKCQRYWTAGGTLRNVPVGAGRRKNKHSASHQKNAADFSLVASDTGEPTPHQRCSASASTTQHNQLKLAPPRARLSVEACSVASLDSPSMMGIPSFGQESPLCRSMAATTLGMPSSGNHMASDGQKNVIVGFAEGNDSQTGLENESSLQSCTNVQVPKLEDASTDVLLPEGALCAGLPAHVGGSCTVSRESAPLEDARCKIDGLQHLQVPWDHSSNMANSISIDNMVSALPPPNFWPSNGNLWTSIPWPLMNPAIWGPPVLGWSSPWNMPLNPVAIPGPMVSAPKQRLQPNGHPLAPKTLRIADPVEAARSSIWSTLGLGGPSSSSVSTVFQVNSEKEIDVPMRHVNPAALTRSATFNENN